jgi:hypothetical protein
VDLPPVSLEAILWLGAPPLGSVGVALSARVAKRRAVRQLLIGIGVSGFIVSVLWFLLVLRVEAVVT